MAESTNLNEVLNTLWLNMGVRPANRALAVAGVAAHHGTAEIKQRWAERIRRETPAGWEREEALRLLQKPFAGLSRLVEQGKVVIAQSERLRVDWEMGRLCVALEMAAEFRVWVVARDVTRQADGSGVVTRKAVRERLAALGVECTRRHFNRLLAQGEGLFWQAVGDHLYLRSAIHVGVALVERARAAGLDVSGNLPGVRDALLEVRGDLERWEALLYAAWIGGRGYKDDLDIARATLSGLFGRDANTLRRWEKTRLETIVSKRQNFAQCPDLERYYDYIPLHAQAYLARAPWKGKVENCVRVRWQLPNSYHAEVEFHPHRGQAGKVRRAVRTVIPADEQRGGHLLRRYFTPESLKRRDRSLKFRMGERGDPNAPVYVYLGIERRSQQRIFEINNSGFVMGDANERYNAASNRRVLGEIRNRQRVYCGLSPLKEKKRLDIFLTHKKRQKKIF